MMQNKSALSLIEILVSIAIISIVITAILQIQQNNLHFLEKFNRSALNNSYISYAQKEGKNRNKDIYLSDVVDFKDDDIRKELKEIKVHIKDEEDSDMQLPKNDYIQSAKVNKSTYSVAGNKKIFYTFTIQ